MIDPDAVPTLRRRPSPRDLLQRSLFPWTTLLLLLLEPVTGPWWFALLAFVWWRLVTRLG